jgi:hypothetical protein
MSQRTLDLGRFFGCLFYGKENGYEIWYVERAGSLMTVARKITKYKIDLVGVQEVSWDRGGTEPAGEYKSIFSMEREMRIMN